MKLNDAVTGLVTTLRATTAFRDPALTSTEIPVYDGVYPVGGQLLKLVVVGSDGDLTNVQRPIRFTTDWHDFARTLDEVGVIQCAIVVRSGDSGPLVPAAQRAAVDTILTSVDSAIRSSVTAASLGVSTLMWALITSGELVQITTSKGTESRLPFQLSYQALNFA